MFCISARVNQISSLSLQVEKLGKDSLVNCAKTSMSSKLIAGDSDFFANLVCGFALEFLFYSLWVTVLCPWNLYFCLACLN